MSYPNIHELVYSRGKVENDFVFVQYWMFYPSSTLPTDEAKDKDTKVYHEGDWEMMQVAIKIDKDEQKLIPEGATASQHYWRQTCSWNNIETSCKYKPVIYIGGGSHATYFAKDTFVYYTILPFGIWELTDYTDKPTKQVAQYDLRPLKPPPEWWLWKGHWGDYALYWYAPRMSSGPPSPKYTERDSIRIYDNPKGFYKGH